MQPSCGDALRAGDQGPRPMTEAYLSSWYGITIELIEVPNEVSAEGMRMEAPIVKVLDAHQYFRCLI